MKQSKVLFPPHLMCDNIFRTCPHFSLLYVTLVRECMSFVVVNLETGVIYGDECSFVSVEFPPPPIARPAFLG